MDMNLIDSENIGTMNSIREIRKRNWPVCVYVSVCLCGTCTYLTRLGNECQHSNINRLIRQLGGNGCQHVGVIGIPLVPAWEIC